MSDAEALRRAEVLVMNTVIDLHYLAGHTEKLTGPAVTQHIRRTADRLNDLAIELRTLAQVDQG